jgi:hypothetical protein
MMGNAHGAVTAAEDLADLLVVQIRDEQVEQLALLGRETALAGLLQEPGIVALDDDGLGGEGRVLGIKRLV